jgi:hypothetical protein
VYGHPQYQQSQCDGKTAWLQSAKECLESSNRESAPLSPCDAPSTPTKNNMPGPAQKDTVEHVALSADAESAARHALDVACLPKTRSAVGYAVPTPHVDNVICTARRAWREAAPLKLGGACAGCQQPDLHNEAQV